MSEKPSKFAAILKNRAVETEEAVAEVSVASSITPQQEARRSKADSTRKGKQGTSAKSKNPDYVQVTAYIPAAVHKAAKINLLKLTEDKDFSELLADLLIAWNSKR